MIVLMKLKKLSIDILENGTNTIKNILKELVIKYGEKSSWFQTLKKDKIVKIKNGDNINI
jgi:hypothetical protein